MIARLKTALLAGSVLAGLAAAPVAAWAQETPGGAAEKPPMAGEVPGSVNQAGPKTGSDANRANSTAVGEVVITGSRIRRSAATIPTPIIQVTREEVLTTGQSTLIDYLATIPALSNSQVPSDTTGSLNIAGVSLANLRSLGAGRTLTLVDGRRHVGSLLGNLAVDVDTIPRLLIQDIEIVTGGASSIYGADAVSGVLNFRLRKDFEGVELDGNYGMTNSRGQTSKRVSGLVGHNFLDKRLNVYLFAEKERQDEVHYSDLEWAREGCQLIANDVDPSTAPDDGITDNKLVCGLRTLSRARGGVALLANGQQFSPTSNPLVPFQNCATGNPFTVPTATAASSVNIPVGYCFNVDPGRTYVFDNGAPRLANFGTFRSQVGLNRTLNVGGEGLNPNTEFSTDSATPESDSNRFQVGFNFALHPNLSVFGEYKYVDETNSVTGQNSFGDVYLLNTPNTVQPYNSVSSLYQTGLDNAFLPTTLLNAIQTNQRTVYGAPTATAPGQVTGTVLDPRAVLRTFIIPRAQLNERKIDRYVLGLRGTADRLFFAKDLSYELSYVHGQMRNVNTESGLDKERFSLAIDAVRDTTGILGSAGAIVCRSKLLAAQGAALPESNPVTTAITYAKTDPTIAACVPYNIFGQGQASAEAVNYVSTAIHVRQKNIEDQALATISGSFWDFFGAGPIGVAIGGEYRKEQAEGIGRSSETGMRDLQLNTGPDFLRSSYETKEGFGEVRIPLVKNSWLGNYGEVTGSYRYSDYSTFGGQEVYGVNLLYRPVRDLTLKTSYNTSIRVPNLAETNNPATQTFLNGFSDPCDARVINALSDRAQATNRIANCGALAAAQGLNLNFGTSTAANAFNPTYLSIPGANQGNPNLKPETSESFTASLVYQPRFLPRLTLALDYYQIRIDDVIAAVTASTAAANCVNMPQINTNACQTLTRSPTTFQVTTFIQGSINYAALSTRGLDFTVGYSSPLPNLFGRDIGRFSYQLRGNYLIQQKNYLDINNPTTPTNLDSALFYPRVRMTSSLTYSPTSNLSVNWTFDYQTANEILDYSAALNNADNRSLDYYTSGDFIRHDFTVRYQLRKGINLRAGVVNAFNAHQADYLVGSNPPSIPPPAPTLYSNFDPFGRRFFVGANLSF